METRKKIKSSPADKVFTVMQYNFYDSVYSYHTVSDSEYACSCI